MKQKTNFGVSLTKYNMTEQQSVNNGPEAHKQAFSKPEPQDIIVNVNIK